MNAGQEGQIVKIVMSSNGWSESPQSNSQGSEMPPQTWELVICLKEPLCLDRTEDLEDLEILCVLKERSFYRVVLSRAANLSLLPLGYNYSQEEKIRNQNRKWHLQRGGSATFHLESPSFPTKIFFHGSEGAQNLGLAVERGLQTENSES